MVKIPLRGDPMELVFPENVVQNLRSRLRMALEDGTYNGVQVFELDHQRTTFEVNVVRHVSADDELRLGVLFRELQGREQALKDLLIAQEAMRDATRMRDTVFSVLAHDLRDPILQLNSIVMLMREFSQALDPKNLESFAEDLERSANRLNSGLKSLMHWSDVQRGSLSPKVTEFNVREAISDCIADLAEECSHKAIEVEVEGDVKSRISTDPTMLSFILRNVLSNAVKFSYEKGTVRCSHEVGRKHHVLTIVDGGVGMSTEDLSLVLDPLRHHSTEGTRGERGMGLGLMICQRFTNLLRGELSIESEPGKGTLVRLVLPA